MSNSHPPGEPSEQQTPQRSPSHTARARNWHLPEPLTRGCELTQIRYHYQWHRLLGTLLSSQGTDAHPLKPCGSHWRLLFVRAPPYQTESHSRTRPSPDPEPLIRPSGVVLNPTPFISPPRPHSRTRKTNQRESRTRNYPTTRHPPNHRSDPTNPELRPRTLHPDAHSAKMTNTRDGPAPRDRPPKITSVSVPPCRAGSENITGVLRGVQTTTG
jgi:hypothetical protein